MADAVIKVIRTREDYELALAAIEKLTDRVPEPGTQDADRLELLTVLVEDYEKKLAPAELPTPIEAIRFRMEQEGLTQGDLVPYIGSKSKVSEVLSGKRPLSLAMIRSLHAGLGIPAKVLLYDQNVDAIGASEPAWEKYPLADMVRLNWITNVSGLADALRDPERTLKPFLRPAGAQRALAALFKRTRYIRAGRTMNPYALEAWIVRVVTRALREGPQADIPYVPGSITHDVMRDIARLSAFDEGPRLARQALARLGVALVIERHLRGTHLDGAAILLDNGRPVIGMTLRHDRLDNFWFCLLHELAHVRLHLSDASAPSQFIDDIELEADDPREQEADEAASYAAIPPEAWRASAASQGRAPIAIRMLAQQLHIHEAIVAGRIRRQYNDYRVLGEMVGRGKVRKQFPEVAWGSADAGGDA